MSTLDHASDRPIAPPLAPVAQGGAVSARVRLLYGAGDAANTIKQGLFALFTLFFYTTVMGLPGTWVGIAAAIGLLWDAVVDPFIGHLSDDPPWRLPFGRRHTFMVVGGLVMGVGFALFFSPPQGLDTLPLFLWMVVTGVLVRSGNSLYSIPYYSVGAELSDDYHERTTITATRGAMALLGTMIAATLSVTLFFPDRVPGIDPKLSYAGYPAMGLLFGLLMTVLALTATAGTWHRRHLRADRIPQERPADDFLPGFIAALRFDSFRHLFLSFALFYLGVVVNSTLLIHYLTYYVEIRSSTALAQLQATFYVAALVGALLWMRLARRVEKQRLYLLSMAVVAALLVSAWALMGHGRLLGTGNVGAMLVGQGLAGFFGSILWIVPASMLADVADEYALAHDRRREGAFFGIFNFGQQIATGMSLLLTGLLLDHFARLQAGQPLQSEATVARIGMLFGLLPALLVLAAIGQIRHYRLTQQRVREVQATLRSKAPPEAQRADQTVI
ncbi:MAG: MFS transporter [Anaerolineales bacterium]|nr:MFS transporter [Anaerolineales bacterium]MCB9129188.1 MFS transporter [Ardenticatenales bacterium]